MHLEILKSKIKDLTGFCKTMIDQILWTLKKSDRESAQ